MRGSAAIPLLSLALWSAPAGAQEPDPEKPVVTVSGFVSATLFAQDHTFGFGNGQNAEWASAGDLVTDEWFLGGDVRNTRVVLGIRGPVVLEGWRVNGRMEMDFFGGFTGTGPFSDEQPQPRLRLAYADLTNGRTTVRIGQAWTPLFGNVPVSLSHLAFPLGYGSAGMIGWRFPGLYLYHTLTGAEAPIKVQATLAAFRGSWVGGNPLDNVSFGETAAIPQLEARLDLSGKTAGGTGWGAYVVGHVDRKDLSGAGAEALDDELTGTAVEVGASVQPGPLTLQGNAYWGRAIGQQFGHITQFGDIEGWGAWAQAGYRLSDRWSVWGYYGTADPDDDDIRNEIIAAFIPTPPSSVRREGRLRNRLFSAMLRYNVGPYSLGAEWLRADTEWTSRFLRSGAVADEDFERTGNQLAFSVLLVF